MGDYKKPEPVKRTIGIVDIDSEDERIKDIGMKIIIVHALILLLAAVMMFFDIEIINRNLSKFMLLVVVSLLIIGAYAGIVKRVAMVGAFGHNTIARGKKALFFGVFCLILALFILYIFFL